MTDAPDMGPFSGMNPELVRAVSAYGTEPYRQVIRIPVREVDAYYFDEMPTSIDGWIAWLESARDQVPQLYLHTLQCVLKWESGCYDSEGSASLDIWYERLETDAEMIKRVNQGISYVYAAQEQERATFERLRAKFT